MFRRLAEWIRFRRKMAQARQGVRAIHANVSEKDLAAGVRAMLDAER